MTVTVRPAQARDLDALVAGCLGCARDSEGLEPDPAVVRAATRAALEDASKARFFVAEQEGAGDAGGEDGAGDAGGAGGAGGAVDAAGGAVVVGSLMVTPEWSDWYGNWNWWLQSVYVHPEHRGRGVYSALYDAVHAAARAAGDVRTVRLYVHEGNESALRAYWGHGMEEAPYRVFEAAVAAASTAPSTAGSTAASTTEATAEATTAPETEPETEPKTEPAVGAGGPADHGP